MKERTIIINPGSSSWWLVNLLPILYFDRIEIDQKEIVDIKKEGDKSTYNEHIALMLDLFLDKTNEEIIRPNRKLPPRGKTSSIIEYSTSITDQLIKEAANSSKKRISLVKAGELKNALVKAYRYWISFNKQKTKFLHKSETLYDVLINDIIPESFLSINKIKNTHAYELPNLLEKDQKLKIVLQELVRNSILIIDLSREHNKAIYDHLIAEFLDLIELIERVRVFKELPNCINDAININILNQLYNFRINKINTDLQSKMSIKELFYSILKEREKFKKLRKRITELDNVIEEKEIGKDYFYKEISSLIQEINSLLNRINKIGTYVFWGGGLSTIALGNILLTFDPIMQFIFGLLLFNPFVEKATKELIENYYLLEYGLRKEASSRIAIIRDSMVTKPIIKKTKIYTVKKTVFDFWV